MTWSGVILTVVASLAFSNALLPDNDATTEQCTLCSESRISKPTSALIVFNATLPMMQFTIDGSNFHTELLHMTSKQIRDLRTEALEYFQESFGITAEKHQKDIAIRLYETNPMVKLRCVYLSSESYVPPEGFVVRDGGWMMTVINQNGIILDGKFSGMHAPFGTTFSLGHWVILRVDKSGHKMEPLIWKNKHVAPGGIASYNEGSRSFHGIMEVYSEEFGKGEALHVAKYNVDSKGRATAQFRNVITFQNE